MSLAGAEHGMIRRIRQAAACLAALMLLGAPVSAEVVRYDEGDLGAQLNLPITEWRDDFVRPRGIVVMIHGVTLHAGVFDVAARKLASQGFRVVAPDLRGFGRWVNNTRVPVEDRKINYTRGLEDTIRLVEHLRDQNRGLPLFCAGESLGANMAINLAAVRPDAVDGLILSSPCIFRRVYIRPYVVFDAVKSFKPSTQLNMKSYISKNLSDDPKVVQGYSADPGIRKTLSLRELIQSKFALKRGYLAASNVPSRIPILILQGTRDTLFKPRGVAALLAKLPAEDEKVEWFDGRGHLLLETAHVRPEVLTVVNVWLKDRLAQLEISAAQVSKGSARSDETVKQVQ